MNPLPTAGSGLSSKMNHVSLEMMRLLPHAAVPFLFANLAARADTIDNIVISTTVHGAPAEILFSFDAAQLQAMDGR